MCMSVTLDGVVDWTLDLLATLTHDSSLHLVITPSLISTLYKSLEHGKSFPACSVFIRYFMVKALTTDTPPLPSSSPLWTAAPFQLRILQSQSHIATDSQSISQSCFWAPFGAHDQILRSYCLTITVLSLCGALSDERRGLSFVSHCLL
jgi:hypothetical protein